jgi:cation transport ATPase
MSILFERFLRRALIVAAIAGLIFGLIAWSLGLNNLAGWLWAAGSWLGAWESMPLPWFSMSAALELGENLAGVVIAVMYAGGSVLEDFAVARAERDLKSLIDRAPRSAHRRDGSRTTERSY